MNEDIYHGKNRSKRSTSGWNGYYLGDIWKSRSSTDTSENGNHHTYPPSEVFFRFILPLNFKFMFIQKTTLARLIQCFPNIESLLTEQEDFVVQRGCSGVISRRGKIGCWSPGLEVHHHFSGVKISCLLIPSTSHQDDLQHNDNPRYSE